MIKACLSELAPYLNATLVGEDITISQVYTDTRHYRDDSLFVALKGPNFDAHEFLQKVVSQGAKAVVVEKQCDISIPQLVVKDTRLALGDLARFNREKIKLKCAAITGSSGKTTVKEMLAAILQNIGSTHATKGNFNNEIGVPLTLLDLQENHQFGVIELGANRPGEIAYTASITQPDIAVINNVAAAHIEGFGDLRGVARAKSEIYGELKPDGIAVVNNDDEFADFWKKSIKNTILTYSCSQKADVVANNIQLQSNHCPSFELAFNGEKCYVKLPLAGIHNVNNALAAATCAIGLGVSLKDIALGLTLAPSVQGRLTITHLSNGCCLIDDSYNANLDSMRAAIELLKSYSGSRILVIGDMAELGELGRQCHEEIGCLANQAKIDKLFSFGVLTKFSQTQFNGEKQHFSNQEELIQQLKHEANAQTTILVKGSRSAHMEKVIIALREHFENESFASHRGGH